MRGLRRVHYRCSDLFDVSFFYYARAMAIQMVELMDTGEDWNGRGLGEDWNGAANPYRRGVIALGEWTWLSAGTVTG